MSAWAEIGLTDPTGCSNGRSRRAERQLLTGYEAAGKSFKVHLDGYDQRDRAGPSKSARNT